MDEQDQDEGWSARECWLALVFFACFLVAVVFFLGWMAANFYFLAGA